MLSRATLMVLPGKEEGIETQGHSVERPYGRVYEGVVGWDEPELRREGSW